MELRAPIAFFLPFFLAAAAAAVGKTGAPAPTMSVESAISFFMSIRDRAMRSSKADEFNHDLKERAQGNLAALTLIREAQSPAVRKFLRDSRSTGILTSFASCFYCQGLHYAAELSGERGIQRLSRQRLAAKIATPAEVSENADLAGYSSRWRATVDQYLKKDDPLAQAPVEKRRETTFHLLDRLQASEAYGNDPEAAARVDLADLKLHLEVEDRGRTAAQAARIRGCLLNWNERVSPCRDAALALLGEKPKLRAHLKLGPQGELDRASQLNLVREFMCHEAPLSEHGPLPPPAEFDAKLARIHPEAGVEREEDTWLYREAVEFARIQGPRSLDRLRSLAALGARTCRNLEEHIVGRIQPAGRCFAWSEVAEDPGQFVATVHAQDDYLDRVGRTPERLAAKAKFEQKFRSRYSGELSAESKLRLADQLAEFDKLERGQIPACVAQTLPAAPASEIDPAPSGPDRAADPRTE